MGESSAIAWTDATVNFWRGCHKVSPGCAHCYMFTGQYRYGRDPSIVTLASPATFNAPLSRKWRAKAAEIAEREGRRMRVFTCSWSDFFHDDADPWRDAAWDVIRRCPEYDWQILTKRPELIADRLPADWGDGWSHVWLGVSIENRRFVHRADLLREIPAAVRFISAEPLLGPLVLHEFPERHRPRPGFQPFWTDGYQGPELDLEDIGWLIVGGESGKGFRPMRNEWVRDLHDACRDHGTAFFVKQGAAYRNEARGDLPDDLWGVREFPRQAVTA